MSDEIIVLDEMDTIYSADSVESYPNDSTIMAIGTYQITESKTSNPSRKGRLYMIKINPSHPIIKVETSFETNAILDMKWNHQTNQLYIADSKGIVSIYNNNTLLTSFQTTKNPKDDVLCLSLDISNRLDKSNTLFCTSQSDGYLSILDTSIGFINEWKAHDYEAWISAFDYHDTKIVYSGGDDCLLKVWDVGTRQLISTIKTHTMGVCSIQSNPHVEYQFASGSYDEKVHIWDKRNLKTPTNTIDCGGGVWRLKWHPYNHNLLLVKTKPPINKAACMHNGFHIIETTQPLIKSSLKKHESLGYGADWVFDKTQDYIGTCSFYDHKFVYSKCI